MALDAVVRFENTDLYMPDGMTGYLDFYLPEIEDVQGKPAPQMDIQRAQLGNITIFEKYTEHYLFDVTFRIASRDTYEKLDSLFQLGARTLVYDPATMNVNYILGADTAFWILPYMLVYPLERFKVVWLNRDDFGQTFWRGYQAADEPVKCQFQEALGVPCYPPS